MRDASNEDRKLTCEEADEMMRRGHHPELEGYEIESPQEWLARHVYENTRGRVANNVL